MKKIENTYVDDSRFMEFIDEIATQITEMNFGYETYEDENRILIDKGESFMNFTDEAQEYYNEMYDEYEMMANNIMGVYKHHDMIMHIYPTKKNK